MSMSESASPSGTVTVWYFDNGTREVVSRDFISQVDSIPYSGKSKLAIGCFIRDIRGRDAVVIDAGSTSESANAMPSAAATSSPSGSRKRPREATNIDCDSDETDQQSPAIVKSKKRPSHENCEKMFMELKEQLNAIRNDVSKIKNAGHSSAATDLDMDSLLSSLESTSSPQPALFSPLSAAPPAPAPPVFRPRANSMPPIFLEPYHLEALPASRAQKLRSDYQFSQPPASVSIIGPHHISAGADLQPSAAGHFSSPPLLSPVSSQPPLYMSSLPLPPVSSQHKISSRAPLPTPSFMPLKAAETIIEKYQHYLNEEKIGRLTCKLARFSFFGGADKHPLDPAKLMEMKHLLKGKFPNESPTNFEGKWGKCTDSIDSAEASVLFDCASMQARVTTFKSCKPASQ